MPPGPLEPELRAPNLSHQEHELSSRSPHRPPGAGGVLARPPIPALLVPWGRPGPSRGRSGKESPLLGQVLPERKGPSPPTPLLPLPLARPLPVGRIPARLQRLPAQSSALFLLCFPGEAPASVHGEMAQQPRSGGRQGAGRAPDVTLSSWSQSLGAKAGGRRGRCSRRLGCGGQIWTASALPCPLRGHRDWPLHRGSGGLGPLPSARGSDSAGSYRALLEGLGPCEGGMCQGGAGLSWKPVQVAWSKQ